MTNLDRMYQHTLFDDDMSDSERKQYNELTREQEMVRAYLEGSRLYHRHTTVLGIVSGIVLLLLGFAIGLCAPVAYDLITIPPDRGVMDTAP